MLQKALLQIPVETTLQLGAGVANLITIRGRCQLCPGSFPPQSCCLKGTLAQISVQENPTRPQRPCLPIVWYGGRARLGIQGHPPVSRASDRTSR